MKASTTVRHFPLTKTAGAVLVLLLAGCAQIPADTGRAAAPDFARAQHAAAIELARDAWPNQQWWREYRDPQLDALVERALKDNPTMAVARARLATAGATVRAEQAAAGARLDLGSGANRQRYSSNGFFPPPLGGAWFNDISVQARASYDLDWWGKHRAQIAAALGEANARQAEAAQTSQVLAAAVAQSYFRLQLLWARQDNTKALVAVENDLLADRKARIAHGLATIDEQRNTELDLATLNERAEGYATQGAREREALRALVGAGSEDLGELARRTPAPAQAALPSRLGIELLARRPDLQAARWRVESALGRVQASEAAFYPDINLSAAFGMDAMSISHLLDWSSRTPFVGGVLSLPLFDSGRLQANLAISRAERDEIIADYNQSVVDAVREVAEEGATLQGIVREQRAHEQAREAATRLESNARARLARGLADRGALLQARVNVLRQQDTALQLTDAQLQTQVALAKALGGGYRAESPQTAAIKTQTQQH